jgi:TorA maturation chaperone TorD
MFVGPGRVSAPPWESLYRDPERLHFSNDTLAVRAAYGKYDLASTALGREPDDHIGFELDFLRALCESARQKAGSGDEAGLVEILRAQQTFLDEHLLQWAPAWTRDVLQNAETDFYRGMAQLLDAYLRLDRRILEEMLHP